MSIIFLTYAIYRRILREESRSHMGRWISYQDQENAEKYVSCPGSRNSTLWGLRPADRQLSLTWMNTKHPSHRPGQGFSQEEWRAYMQGGPDHGPDDLQFCQEKAGGGAGGRSPAPDRGRLLPALRRKRRSLRLRRMQKASAGLQPENSYGGGSS